MKVASKVTYNRIPVVEGQVKARVTNVIRRTLALIERTAKAVMEGPKHGRAYKRKAITRSARGRIGSEFVKAGAKARIGMRVVDPKTKGARVTVGYTYHRASAPGEAPAVDFGLLRNSIQSNLVSALAGIVFTNQEYGPVLEFGGRKIKARPFMKPAAKDGQDYYVQEMANELGDIG